jgi:transcriptional regulator with XRE-family HTH domain
MTLTKEEMKEQGRRIKKVRQDQDLKQDDFCAQIGLSRFSLGRIERGEQAIDSQSLFHLKTKFGISADWILFGTELKSGKEYDDLKKDLEKTEELLAAKTEIIQLLKKTAGII